MPSPAKKPRIDEPESEAAAAAAKKPRITEPAVPEDGCAKKPKEPKGDPQPAVPCMIEVGIPNALFCILQAD